MTNIEHALQGSVPDGSALSFTRFVVARNQVNGALYKDKKNNIFIGTSLDVFKLKDEHEKNNIVFESYYKNMLGKKDYLTNMYTHVYIRRPNRHAVGRTSECRNH